MGVVVVLEGRARPPAFPPIAAVDDAPVPAALVAAGSGGEGRRCRSCSKCCSEGGAIPTSIQPTRTTAEAVAAAVSEPTINALLPLLPPLPPLLRPLLL